MVYKNISKLLFLALCLGFFFKVKAQVPQGINYQAIARDNACIAYTAGTPVTVGFKISTSTTTFSENHATNVGQFGLVNLVIGKGTPVSGSFATFDWSQPNVTIDVSIDGVPIGSQELQSVPYAMHCATADAVIGGGSLWNQSGSDIYYDAGSVGVGVTTVQSNADLEVKNRVLAGPAYVGNIYTGTSWAGIQHVDLKLGVNQYALLQAKDGSTYLNSYIETGQAIIHLQNNGIDVVHLTHEGDLSGNFNSKMLFKGVVDNRNQPAGKLAFEHTLSGTSYTSAEITGGVGGAADAGELRFNVLFKNSLIEAMYIHEDASITLSSLAGAAGLVSVDASGTLVAGGSITEIDPQVGTNTTGYVPRWSGTALVTGSVYDNGTSVGIGTSAPAAGNKLEVVGSTRLAGDLNIDSGTPTFRLRTATGVQQAYIQHAGNLSIDASVGNILIGNGNLFINKTNNRVGIGTNTPANKLDVEGSLAIGTSYSGTSTAPANGLIVQGNVGIGTNNPGMPLQIAANNAGYAIRLDQGSTVGDGALFYINTTSSARTIFQAASNVVGFAVKGNGYVGIGVSSPDQKLHVVDNINGFVMTVENQSTATSADGINILLNNTLSSNDYVYFQRTGGLTQGRIAADGVGSVSYLTSSDRRLKEKIKDFDDGLISVMSLKPREYFYRGGTTLHVGFIAQELQEVFPYAVSGKPDGDVKTEPMMVDYSKLTPLLTKAIQEQQVLIEENQKLIQQLQEELNALKRQ